MLETKITEKAKDVLLLRKKLKENYEAVIVLVGDGTVNEVISGIAEKDHIPN